MPFYANACRAKIATCNHTIQEEEKENKHTAGESVTDESVK
jgi:hypothetical protein